MSQSGWFQKLKQILVNPKRFFAVLETDKKSYYSLLAFSAKNFLLGGIVAGTLLFFFSPFAGGGSTIIRQSLGIFYWPFLVVSLIFFFEVVGFILLVLGSAVLNFILFQLGAEGSFKDTFAVNAYVTSVLPVIFVPVSSLYAFYLGFLGLSEVHSVSSGKVFLSLALIVTTLIGILLIFSGTPASAGLVSPTGFLIS